MHILLQDLRYAFRKLARSPGFTFIAVATLALVIGSTTAVFSIVYGVLLKPLPYSRPEQLVRLANVKKGQPMPLSTVDLIDFTAQARGFSGIAGMDNGSMNLTEGAQEPVRLWSGRVGANFFDVLGMPAEVGRTFAANEDRSDAPRVAVLSDALWRDRFGADRRIVGQTIALNGKTYTVIGVAPPSVHLPDAQTQVWVPMVFAPFETDPANRGGHSIFAIARVKPGASVQSADREMRALADRLARLYPRTNTGMQAVAEPLQDQTVRNVRPALWTLLGSVGFVLLIACANIANLLLVRATARETEMALRAALGADRWRIVRQLVTESVLLSLAGAVVGAAIAAWIVEAVVTFGPAGLPRLAELTVDHRVLLFAAAIGVLTGLLFGIVPALHAARAGLGEMLRSGGRSGSGHRAAQRTRALLVMSEMALAIVLLAGAGLMLRSFNRLLAVDPGFRSDNVVSVDVSLPAIRYRKDHDVGSFYDRLLDRVRALPGVQRASVAFGRPLSELGMRVTFEVHGWAPSTPDNRHVADIRPVSPGYFETMGIPVIKGRNFSSRDLADAPGALIVSEEFVRKYFPGQDPVGRQMDVGLGRDTTEWGSRPPGGEIVGVARDVKLAGPSGETYPLVYMVMDQYPVRTASVLVRTKLPPTSFAATLRGTLRSLDPDLPLYDLTTMNHALSRSVAQPFFYTVLLVAFAALALVLAALGIYGVISYGVSERRREIGIRLALGASGHRVQRLVLLQGLAIAGAGAAIGIAAALGLTRLIASMLFGIGATDAIALGGASLLLLAVAALASWLPARRASRLDPVVALRSD